MNQDLFNARSILHCDAKTCVLCKGDTVYSDDRRGVAPLLELLDSGKDLRGFSAADKVVGKAAAFLYRLMGISALYAGVISESAKNVLAQENIPVFCDATVPVIRNRTQTGLCPMESAVWDINDPSEALEAVRNALSRLQSQK